MSGLYGLLNHWYKKRVQPAFFSVCSSWPLTTKEAKVSLDPALLTALHLYIPESGNFRVGTLSVQLLSQNEIS